MIVSPSPLRVKIDNYKHSFPKEPLPCTAESFESEVERFKGVFGLRSLEVLFDESKDSETLRSLFLINPTIESWLTRTFATFDDCDHPVYSPCERNLYAYAKERGCANPFSVTCRSKTHLGSREISNVDLFFRSGCMYSKVFWEHLTNSVKCDTSKESNNSYGIFGVHTLATYENFNDFIKDILSLDYKGKQAVLFSYQDEGHVISCLATIDYDLKELVSFCYFNTWKKKPVYEEWEPRPFAEVFRGYFDNLGYKNLPIYNCSIELQFEDTDINCAFYRNIFIRAIWDFLSTDSELAEELFNANRVKKSELEKKFRKKLKAALPYFFTYSKELEKYKIRPWKERIEFLLKYRWQVGRLEVIDYCNKAHEYIEREFSDVYTSLPKRAIGGRSVNALKPSFPFNPFKQELIDEPELAIRSYECRDDDYSELTLNNLLERIGAGLTALFVAFCAFFWIYQDSLNEA